MRSTNELFQLIKSLTKNEKRYFRMYASMQKGDKIYLRLFDEISRQKVYNEEMIKEKLSGEKFIKQLSFIKNYLYKLIFKSLISFYSESLPDLKISSLIVRAKILFNKALYAQYFKTLAKAKAIAAEYERFGYLIEIIDMERIIVKKEEIVKKDYGKLYNEAESALNQSKNLFGYSKLLNKAFRINRSMGKARDETARDAVRKLLDNSLMEGERIAKSSRAKEMYYLIMETVSQTDNEHESLLENAGKRLKIIEHNPRAFEGHIINHKKDVLFKLLMLSAETKNYDGVEEYFKKFKNASGLRNISEEISNFSFYADFMLNKLIKEGVIKQQSNIIDYIETNLKEYKNKIGIVSELSLRYKIIKLLVLTGNYEEALPRINSLLNHPQLNIRSEFECYLRLLNLIVHFELENYEIDLQVSL
jgi:hypothetical protein